MTKKTMRDRVLQEGSWNDRLGSDKEFKRLIETAKIKERKHLLKEKKQL